MRPGVKWACWTVVFVFGVILMTGCGSSKKTDQALAEKSVEKALERATGGQAKVDLSQGKIKVETKEGTTEFSSSAEWPEDLTGVPKFAYGKVKGVNRLHQGEKKHWSIVLENLQEGAQEKYLQNLKDNDWKIVSTMNMENVGVVQAQKDKLMLNLTVNPENKTALLTVASMEKE